MPKDNYLERFSMGLMILFKSKYFKRKIRTKNDLPQLWPFEFLSSRICSTFYTYFTATLTFPTDSTEIEFNVS